ncbi:MAG: TonB-dependent siderophore receptor [Methyloceanibacter sp.]
MAWITSTNNYSDLGLEFTAPDLILNLFDPDYGIKLSLVAPYQNTNVVQEQTGLYVQDQIKIYDRLVLSLGGRSDQVKTTTKDLLADTVVSSDDQAFTGRAGAVYLFDNGLAPYASYAQSFLPQLGTDFFGTPFKSETGEQYEAGFKYEPPALKNFLFTFAAFDLVRQNVLTQDPGNPLNMIQVGEIRSRGIEFEAVASLDWGLDLQAAYTHLNTEFTVNNDGTQGNTPYGVPDDRIALWADYTFQRGRFAGFGFGAGVRYIAETWGDDANTFKVPAVTLADAAIHYEWDRYRLAVDEEYVASCFAEANGCNFGQRRVVLGSLRYRW